MKTYTTNNFDDVKFLSKELRDTAKLKFTVEAGLLYRRELRKFLMKNDVNFQEDAGWLESSFFIKECPYEIANAIITTIEKWM